MNDPGPRPSAFVVPSEKLTHYLPEAGHPKGGPKSRFFSGYGFTLDRYQELASALLEHAASAAHLATLSTPRGVKYVFGASLATPCGRSPTVRTIWQVDAGTGPPARFITAVPIS